MSFHPIPKRLVLSAALAATTLGSIAGVALPTAALAQNVQPAPTNVIALSVGSGRLVRLDRPMTDLFVANDGIADVQVRSGSQLYVFGKAPGETTLYATDRAGRTVYSANVRVGNNIGSLANMLALTMPEAQITATPMNGMVVLTGTVAAPDDGAEAERLVQAFVGENVPVISRLKTATPLQVLLQVRISEVSRTVSKDIGFNIATADATSGFKFGVGQGRDFFSQFVPGGPVATATSGPGSLVNPIASGTSLFGAGRLFGLDILGALDLAENSGLAASLAEPTLVALSGETASFLAGGEFPIATTSGLNGTEIQFKEYGVSLSFTPTVLEGGRISMRVRPEVSELTSQGAITLGGTEIPALTTRRAETTVELGSGQSFMIGGLLRNNGNNTVEKAPWLGDLPILGALFRSNGFRRNETELVIVVTPYLVKPTTANQVALPTDGFRTSSEAARVLLDQRNAGVTGEQRPSPQAVAPVTVAPGIGPVGAADPALPPAAAPVPTQQADRVPQRPQPAPAQPGFSF